MTEIKQEEQTLETINDEIKSTKEVENQPSINSVNEPPANNIKENVETEKEITKEKTKRKPRTTKKEINKENETSEHYNQGKNLMDEFQTEKLIEEISNNCIDKLKDFQDETIEQLKSELDIINSQNQKIKFMQAMAEVHKNIPKIIPNRHVKKLDGKQSEYSYADLTTTVENTRNILSANGLYVEFRHKLSKRGVLKIKCLVHHKDGYTYEGETMKFPVNINDVQAIASSITYMKRYLYNSMFNLTTEYDDDGCKAAEKNTIITSREYTDNRKNQQTNYQKQTTSQNHSTEATKENQQQKQPQVFNPNNNPTPKQIIPDTHKENELKFQCSECNAEISEDEFKFSTFAFGKPYCMACQQNHRN